MVLNEEVIYLTNKQARLKSLTQRLSLNGKNPKDRKDFLAYVGHPRGGATVMNAYRIIGENSEGYELREATALELKKLEAKYAYGAGNSWSRPSLRFDS